MDRPVSAASSASAAAAVTTAHKRQQSSVIRNGLTAMGTTVIALFTTNLRLLDLDLEPDWPQITAQSFSNQDARNKIKCTEYALYQLFRLYDPATTADKLRPFFPPLEPLQSVNLRAALFRCLGDLKKNGVLARETVLRKTMLDECSGEKFWELCLAFSAVVLRKQMSQNKDGHGTSVAYKLGTATTMSKKEKDSMLPLAIAHKSALNRVLKEKQKRWEACTTLYDLLVQKEMELKERRNNTQKKSPTTISETKLSAVEQAVEKSWIGDNDLKQALIGGDVCADGDGMCLRSFDDLWKHNVNDGNADFSDFGTEKGFLQNMKDNVAEQSRRLRKWQTFHEKLIASKPRSMQSSNRSSASVNPVVRFDRHRELNVRDVSPSRDAADRQTHERHDSVLRYDEMLTAMRDELRKNVSSQGGGPPPAVPSIPPIRRAQTQPLTASKRASVILDPPAPNPHHHHHQRSPSQTAVPMWALMGARTPSRSKSYQQPKVVSQRVPIPLKSEIFSPLKDKRRSSAGSNSLLASPSEKEESVTTPERTKSVSFEDDDDRRDSGVPSKSGSEGLGISTAGCSNRESLSSPTELDGGNSPALERHSEINGLDSTPSQPPRPGVDRTATAPASILRPPLAERTRMSMLPNSVSTINDPTSQPTNSPSSEEPFVAPSPTLHSKSAQLATDYSLAARTREAISLAPQPSYARSELQYQPKKVYPVNQFETPKRPSRHQAVDSRHASLSPAELLNGQADEDGAYDETPQPRQQQRQPEFDEERLGQEREQRTPQPTCKSRRDVTPLEQLLSPDADYDSVFKSRPRVVHSPKADTGVEMS